MLGRRHSATLFVLAGLLPILVVHGAYAYNLLAGLAGCNVYVEGCHSVSRAVRSGPGLILFKVAALPIALITLLAWFSLRRPPATRWILALGTTGMLAFLVYAFALGTDGQFYRWMRRYGVVLYFAGTGLAQLLLARRLLLQPEQLRSVTGRAARVAFYTSLLLTWGVGVLSAGKRRLSDDPAFIDRLQNTLEWYFALGLSSVFLALGCLLMSRKARSG